MRRLFVILFAALLFGGCAAPQEQGGKDTGEGGGGSGGTGPGEYEKKKRY